VVLEKTTNNQQLTTHTIHAKPDTKGQGERSRGASGALEQRRIIFD
jgi:hypothetical protein